MSVTTTCRDIKELHPVAQKACNLFMSECEKAGIKIFITETYRSQARQDYLYKQGRTAPYKNNNKVTWTTKSNHTGRMAWDIAVSPPKNLYDQNEINKAGAIAKKLGITWGGSWDGPYDSPHFEVKASWKAPVTISNDNEKKEGIRMYEPSNSAFLKSTIETLKKLEDKKKFGDQAISSSHREKLEKGELSLDDAVAIVFVAIERGLLNK